MISLQEFEIFLTSFTRLKSRQALIMFNYLDDARRGVLHESHILAIWEHKLKVEREKEQNVLERSRDEGLMKSQFDLSALEGDNNQPF